MQAEFPNLDHATLDRLAREHGDSLYILSIPVLRANVTSFREAFQNHWPRTRLAYSYKTNYMPYLCHLLRQWGCLAEVVSGMEYDLARIIGANGKEIIFNGPYKRTAELQRALRDGAVVNVESFSEIKQIEEISRRNDHCRLRVGIRAAFQVRDSSTRFGLDISNGDFRRAVERLAKTPNVLIVGFHTHMIPPGRTPEGYRFMAETLINLYLEYAERLPLEFLDLGGGFFSNMPQEMRGQFGPQIPTFSDYGAAIAGALREALHARSELELIVEPGMALVADAMQFIARVVDIKSVCGRKVALLSGSVYNVKPTKSLRNLPIRRVAGGQQAVECSGVDLVGHTCMEDDTLYRGYAGPLAVDDFIVFKNAGSYTLTLRPPFIQPNSPVLSLEDDGRMVVVKRAETVDDVFQTYQVRRQQLSEDDDE